jgi:hypothetical protein
MKNRRSIMTRNIWKIFLSENNISRFLFNFKFKIKIKCGRYRRLKFSREKLGKLFWGSFIIFENSKKISMQKITSPVQI